MSKLNPQKASAYVGPGVLRKGGKITPVPNGPLIKKTGKFKGSTLKNGGTTKTTTKQTTEPPETLDTLYTKKTKLGNLTTNDYVGRMPSGGIEIGQEKVTRTNGNKTSTKKATQSGILGIKYTDDQIRASMNSRKNGGKIKKAVNGTTTTAQTTKKPILSTGYIVRIPGKSKPYTDKQKDSLIDSWMNEKKVNTTIKKKNGGMIKRADGSYSKRGLWDNIRANKGSGKKPTAAMLKQEKKIKAKSKK